MLTLHLAILLLLILLNGFFAMAEIALVSARPARLQPLAAEGSAGAEAALELKSDPSRLLATVQHGDDGDADLHRHRRVARHPRRGDPRRAPAGLSRRVRRRAAALRARDQHGGGG